MSHKKYDEPFFKQFYNSIKNNSEIKETFSLFKDEISNLIKSQKLKSPNETLTMKFVNEFCPDLVKFIMSSKIYNEKNVLNLNQFIDQLIKLFLIQPNPEFFFDSILIITDPKQSFYQSTKKNNTLELYEGNINSLMSHKLIECFTKYIRNKIVMIEKIILIINIFYNISTYFKSNSDKYDELEEFLPNIPLALKESIKSIDDKDIRNLDEKELAKTMENIKEITKYENKNIREQFDLSFLNLGIKFIRSSYLNKQISGLLIIKDLLTNSSSIAKKLLKNNKKKTKEGKDKKNEKKKAKWTIELCKVLCECKIVPYILDRMNQELVIDFSQILEILLYFNFSTFDDLNKLWNITLKQNISTIQPFLEAFTSFSETFPKNLKHQLCNIFIHSEKYSKSLLYFFKNTAKNYSKSSRVSLFEAIVLFYKKQQNNEKYQKNSELFSKTIFALIPKDKELCLSLQEKFETYYINQLESNISFFVDILKAITKSIEAKKAKEFLNILTNTLNQQDIDKISGICSVNTFFIKLLDLYKHLIFNFSEQITSDEFNNLIKLILLIIKYDKFINISDFFKDIFRNHNDYKWKRVFKDKMLLILLERISSQHSISVDLIVNIFELINRKKFRTKTNNLHSATNTTLSESVIDSVAKLKGVELLWKTFFSLDEKKNINKNDLSNETARKQIGSYLCHIYSSSDDSEDIIIFCEKCLKQLSTARLSDLSLTLQILNLILNLIKINESKFDKFYHGIKENMYITKYNTKEINILYQYYDKTQDILVQIPNWMTFTSFYERIGYILNLSINEFRIFIESIPLTYENYNLKKIKKIDVKLLNDSSEYTNLDININENKFAYNFFPSLYLSKDMNFNQLYSLLFETFENPSSEEEKINFNIVKEIKKTTLAILNHISSNPDDITAFYEAQDNWNTIFDLDNLSFFIYRLNLFGNIMKYNSFILCSQSLKHSVDFQKYDNNINEWIDTFYISGGSLYLLTLLLSDAINAFNDQEEELLLIFEISILIINKNDNESIKKKLIVSLAKKKIVENNIVPIAIKYLKSQTLLLTVFQIISEFTSIFPNTFSKFNKFFQLFNFSIFHHNSQIRNLIFQITNFLSSSSNYSKLIDYIIEQLPLASKDENSSVCKEYFQIIHKISQINNESNIVSLKKKLGKLMEKTLYKNYAPKTTDSISQFLFIPPKRPFSIEFFHAFANIVDFLNNTEKVFSFILDNILFSEFRYFDPTEDVFNIMKNILKSKSSLIKLVIPKIKNFYTSFNPESCILQYSTNIVFSSKQYKGIKNLGATCYLNSTIQQLYNITTFLKTILNYHDDSFDIYNDWFNNFQLLLAKLLIYPADFIDPAMFIKQFKWYDTPINTHQQQDAVEFVLMLIDKLTEKIPSLKEIFEGEILHEVIGSEKKNKVYHYLSYEKFTVFPIDVNGYSNIGESLNAFLLPDIFEGNEMYNAGELGKIKAKRFHYMHKLPQVLIFQLKRFTFDVKKGIRQKINTEFSFPLQIDLSHYMKNEISKELTKDNKSYQYELIGIIVHSGDAGSGHYYSLCKKYQKDTFSWIKFNDTFSKVVEFQTIDEISKIGLIGKKSSISDETPYILFYQSENVHEDITQISIDRQVLQNISDEVRGRIQSKTLTDELYSKFLLEIFQNSSHINSLFYYLVSALREITNNDRIIDLFSVMKKILKERSISIDFLKQNELYFTYLLKNNSFEIRKAYSDLICMALDICQLIDPYILFLDTYKDKSLENWTHFDEFLLPLTHIIQTNLKAIDGQKWIEYLIALLHKIESYDSNSSIIENIKLDSLYTALNYFFNSDSMKAEFGSLFLDINFLKNLFKTRRNSKHISIIIKQLMLYVENLNESESSTFDTNGGLFKNIEDYIKQEDDITNLAGVFSVFLNFEKNSRILHSIINIMHDKDYNENEKFMKEIILRVDYIRDELEAFLASNTRFWINRWLFSMSIKIRDLCCELVHKTFKNFPLLSFSEDENENTLILNNESSKPEKEERLEFLSLQKIAKNLYLDSVKKYIKCSVKRMKKSYKLKLMGVDTFNMLPYKNYYDLLKWSIIRTNTLSETILKKPKFLIKTLIKFKKLEPKNSELCLNTLKFIYNIVGTRYARYFFCKRRFSRKFIRVFSDATFDSINQVSSITTVSMIVSLLPPRFSHYLFATNFFYNSLQYCFSSIPITAVTAPQLASYIISNANLYRVAPVIWEDQAFFRNYKDSNYYLTLTISMLIVRQKLSNLFFDLHRFEQILESILSQDSIIDELSSENNYELDEISEKTSQNKCYFSIVAPKQIDVFTEFLKAYQQVGNKRDELIQILQNEKNYNLINNILEFSQLENTKTDILLAIFKMLMELFVISQKFEQIVLSYVQNGFLAKIREDVWSGAIELVRFICVTLNSNQREGKAYTFLINELLALKRPYNFKIIVELCNIISIILIQFEPPVNEIVGFLKDLQDSGELPNPAPNEIKNLIRILRDKDAKGIAKLLKIIN